MPVSLIVRTLVWLWFFAALAAGHYGWLTRGPTTFVPAVLLALSGILILLYRRVATLRTWIDEIDLRAIVLLHVTRFVGVYFLLLYQRGELPYRFAVPGGIGDIAVAVLALVVALVPMSDARRIRAIRIWNIVGAIDILLVVSTAARINLSGSHDLAALTVLPLSLLPTFLVPLIIATHVVIFVRLSALDRQSE